MEDAIAWLQDSDLHNQHEKLTRIFCEGMAKFLSRQNPFSLNTFISFYKHDKNIFLKSIIQFRRDVWLSDDHIDTVLHSMGMHHTDSKTRYFVFDLQCLQGFVDTYSINPIETADTSLEKTAKSFIKDTATPSIKEEGSMDKNKHPAGKKVLKTEIGEQNVKVNQKTAQEYPWMNMVFDTANEAKDFFVEWSDGKIFFNVKSTLNALRDACPNKKFEYGGVDAASQKVKEETRKTALKLSGFSEAADMLKLLQNKAKEDHRM
ncbi:hypothetical protein BGZ96_004786, partial [Linnemannia gamsii]